MSDYPMLISNKLHSFRNFILQIYEKLPDFPFASDYFPQKPQYLNFFRLYLHIQS